MTTQWAGPVLRKDWLRMAPSVRGDVGEQEHSPIESR